MRQGKRILAFILLLALAAGQFAGLSAQAKSQGYKFTYKSVTVYMGGPAKKLIKKAGKPKSVKTAKSCAYDGKDRTYKYKDFILYTYSNTDNGPEYVCGITFLTKKVSTKEGIKIGSPYSQVRKKYGTKKDYLGVYTYKKGTSKLQFEVTDDVVTNIRYVKA
ncbi:MAG: hypothetical protein J1F02_04865 [Lachnospiraceae bacterium]|nr:hypothetical protein [Lachnospiraceae bacterium]